MFYLIFSIRMFSFLTLIATIVLLCATAFSFYMDYTLSMGFDIGFLSGLFLSSLVPVKPRRLTKLERSQVKLPENLKEILVGLMLGDGFIQSRGESGNARLFFEQGIIHKDYLYHLFNLFKPFCSTEPKEYIHKVKGKSYSGLAFKTLSLACFEELHKIFYIGGKKVVPGNIQELLTPLVLAYWICDDGSWLIRDRYVVLCTDGFRLEDVDLLVNALNDKFDLKCNRYQQGAYYRIKIPPYSIPDLQDLVAPHIPPMMRHRIGL